MCSTASYLMVLFAARPVHRNGTIEIPCTSTCPFVFSRSSNFLLSSGVSNQALFKAYNLTERLGEVYLHQVFHVK